MQKLNVNDVIIITKPVCGMEEIFTTGQKYRVIDVYQNRMGAHCYTFKNTRKNAVAKISVYSQDIDGSIDAKSFSEIRKDCKLYQVFMKPIAIVKEDK